MNKIKDPQFVSGIIILILIAVGFVLYTKYMPQDYNEYNYGKEVPHTVPATDQDGNIHQINPGIFQGPVPEGYDEPYFRATGKMRLLPTQTPIHKVFYSAT